MLSLKANKPWQNKFIHNRHFCVMKGEIMKILAIGNPDRYEKFLPDFMKERNPEIVFVPRGADDEEIIKRAKGIKYMSVDAIASVSANVINNLPDLKIIHSEGVAYNGIDIEAAREKNIYVCNNKGVNASAVAEQTILLMLSLLRNVIVGDRTEREGGQIKMKEEMMVKGISELADCKIGLIGFGDIAKATAKRLSAFECEMFYYATSQKSSEIEKEYNVKYMSLNEIAKNCDIISIHVPVTDATRGMINREFLSKCKPSAYIVNTARGEIVDNDALCEALINNTIKGAALDTVAPEPTTLDNPLLNLPDSCKDKIIFSPHIGGITTSTFMRAHKTIWQAFIDVENGLIPKNIVNGL